MSMFVYFFPHTVIESTALVLPCSRAIVFQYLSTLFVSVALVKSFLVQSFCFFGSLLSLGKLAFTSVFGIGAFFSGNLLVVSVYVQGFTILDREVIVGSLDGYGHLEVGIPVSQVGNTTSSGISLLPDLELLRGGGSRGTLSLNDCLKVCILPIFSTFATGGLTRGVLSNFCKSLLKSFCPVSLDMNFFPSKTHNACGFCIAPLATIQSVRPNSLFPSCLVSLFCIAFAAAKLACVSLLIALSSGKPLRSAC